MQRSLLGLIPPGQVIWTLAKALPLLWREANVSTQKHEHPLCQLQVNDGRVWRTDVLPARLCMHWTERVSSQCRCSTSSCASLLFRLCLMLHLVAAVKSMALNGACVWCGCDGGQVSREAQEKWALHSASFAFSPMTQRCRPQGSPLGSAGCQKGPMLWEADVHKHAASYELPQVLMRLDCPARRFALTTLSTIPWCTC